MNQNQASPSSLIFCQQTFRSIDKIDNSGAAGAARVDQGPVELTQAFEGLCFKGLLGISSYRPTGDPDNLRDDCHIRERASLVRVEEAGTLSFFLSGTP